MNKTLRPLKISLPRGKTLHLGPKSRGQVHDDTLDRPAFKKLVEAGAIEVLDYEEAALVKSESASNRVGSSTHGHQGNKNLSRQGDR